MTDADAGAAPAADDLQPAASEPRKRARAHRFLVPTLLVLATLIGFVAAFAVWVNRQALNTDNWVTTSSKLLANQQIDDALGGYMVNELFSNVDVAAQLRAKLPAQAQALAGPAAAGLQQLADRAAPRVLANPKVQDVWVRANTAAHKELLRVIEGGGSVVSTKSGVVTLNLHPLVSQLAGTLGLQSQVAAVQSKLQGDTGAKVRGAAQQKLGIKLPPSSGQLVIMRADQLKTGQDVASAVKSLAIVLPLLAVALFALAVWLAHGRRRHALRTTGWCFIVIGALLILIRRVAGNEVVDGLVKVPSNKPAVHEVWSIATSLLYAIAVAMIAYGIVLIVSAWLAGPTRPARFLRQSLAPALRDRPGMAYSVAGGLLLLVIIWGPTPAFRKIIPILLFIALLALGVTALRRQTELEFPGVQHGDALRQLRERRAEARARKAAAASSLAAGGAPTATAPAPRTDEGSQVEELERLTALRDRGALTEEEFTAQKRQVLNGS
jgi:putative oligomerization/nucleic acid binding protein